MQQFSHGRVYLNFPGQGEEGEALLRASYGDANYERLVELKTKYDPENVFRLNQNIRPRLMDPVFLVICDVAGLVTRGSDFGQDWRRVAWPLSVSVKLPRTPHSQWNSRSLLPPS